MVKHRLTKDFSIGFANALIWLTRFDSEDRCLPQEALSLDYFKQAKVKFSVLGIEDILSMAADSVQKEQQETGLNESNLYLEKVSDSLSMAFETGERWFELEDKTHSSQEYSLPFATVRKGRPLRYSPESEQIAELALEMGCPKQVLWTKLKNTLSHTH